MSVTIFAPILLVATAIGPIFDDILVITNSTSSGFRFLDHPSILLITYFCAITKSQHGTDYSDFTDRYEEYTQQDPANGLK